MASKTMLIGLGGRYGAGKDVVANYCHFQFGFEVIGFSDILNKMMMTLNPIVPDYYEGGPQIDSYLSYADIVNRDGYVEAKTNPEIRRLLQVFGTEVGRGMIHKDIWTDLTAQAILAKTDNGISVALTGVRYENEIEMVRRLGGEPIWVTRPGFGDTGAHLSENSVCEEDFDHTLPNDGTIGELENKVGDLLMELTDDQ